MDTIRHQTVESSAFIHFVEMRNRLPPEKHPLAVTTFYRGSRRVIQRSFHKVAGGHQVFQTLLVLNTNCGTAEIVRDSNCRNIHFALRLNLLVGEVLFVRLPGNKGHPLFLHPCPHFVRFGSGHLSRFVIEGGLTQSLFVDAGRIE